MESLLSEIRDCTICKAHLPVDPRPVLAVHPWSKIVIIGQAPGVRVYETGVPWNDKSGDNLRDWMGVSKDTFYDSTQIAIVPMGFCYPGKGKSGDLPPRSECAPQWHTKILSHLEKVELTLLIGQYAQGYYLKDRVKSNLTETVRDFDDYLPNYFVLPHPSPRNNIWRAKNEWFDQEVLPELKQKVKAIL